METITKYNLKGVKDAEEALEKCDCLWTAEQDNMITLGGTNIESHKALVRSDNKQILGVVGKGYTPFQPSYSFAHFQNMLNEHGIKWSQGVVIDKGSKIILKAEFPKKVLIRVGDECVKQLVLINSFNMTTSFTVYLDMERLVCTNGMRSSSKANQISFKHTPNGQFKADDSLKVFSKSVKYFEEFTEQCKYLAQVVADKQMVNSFLSEMFDTKVTTKDNKVSTRTKNQKAEVLGLFKHGAGNNGSTAWDLYNGVTEWVDHNRTPNEDKRMVSALIGSGSDIKKKAFNTLLQMV